MIAELVTLAVAGPITWWLTSPRRLARRAVRRWERVGVEVVRLMTMRAPLGKVPPAAPSGRTCAAGSTGARDVSAAHGAPAASHKPVVSACARPPTALARRVVVLPCSPLGSTTTPHRKAC